MRHLPPTANQARSYIPTLTEQALRSRAMRFPNRTVEQEVLAEVDQRLTKHLRSVEAHLVAQAVDFNAGMTAMKREAREVQAELRDMQLDLMDGKDVDLARWGALERRAQELSNRSTRLSREFVGHHERLSDVLAYATTLQEKYPALHRPICLPTDAI